MGSNGQTWDRESHYEKKTVKEMQNELVKFEEGWTKIQSDPKYATAAGTFYTTHIAYLKMKIAERIGKK